MQQILIYILKWALCLAIMYIPFALLMRKETFHAINRAILIFSVVIAAILPLIEIVIPVKIEGTESLNALSHNAIVSIIKERQQDTSNHTALAFFLIYTTGAALSLISTIINITKIRRAIRKGTLWHEKSEHYTLFCHANETAPFSWFHNIVISEKDYIECGKEIIAHEEGHIRQRHSWDILFISIVKALQWFNPFIYMLMNDLKDIHEFEADRYALTRNSNAQAYQLLILKKAIGEERYSVANNFGRKVVRKRLEMMIRKRSPRKCMFKGAYIPAAAVTAIILFAKPEYIYCIAQQKTAQQALIIEQEEKEKRIIDKKHIICTQPPTTHTVPVEEEPTTTLYANTSRTTKKEETTTATQSPPAEHPESAKEIEESTYSTIKNAEHFAARLTPDKEIFVERSDVSSDIKCSLILEFNTDKKGEISNISTTACNVSISTEAEGVVEQILPHVREKAVATATNYILSKEWQTTCCTAANEATHYTANITIHSGSNATNAIVEQKSNTFWIGTTPIRE